MESIDTTVGAYPIGELFMSNGQVADESDTVQAELPSIELHEWLELTKLLPPLTDEQYQQLKDSIATYGQQVPIKALNDGRIVDGRNRRRACEELGMEPRAEYVDLDDKTALRLGVALNLERRQLTREQQTKLRAYLKREFLEERASGKTQAEAAKAVGIPRSTAANWDVEMGHIVHQDNMSEKSPDLRRKVDEVGQGQIRAMAEKGIPRPQIAAELGISAKQVDRIIKADDTTKMQTTASDSILFAGKGTATMVIWRAEPDLPAGLTLDDVRDAINHNLMMGGILAVEVEDGELCEVLDCFCGSLDFVTLVDYRVNEAAVTRVQVALRQVVQRIAIFRKPGSLLPNPYAKPLPTLLGRKADDSAVARANALTAIIERLTPSDSWVVDLLSEDGTIAKCCGSIKRNCVRLAAEAICSPLLTALVQDTEPVAPSMAEKDDDEVENDESHSDNDEPPVTL